MFKHATECQSDLWSCWDRLQDCYPRYGGEAHYWKRCAWSAKMGAVEIEKSSVFTRATDVAPLSIPAPMSEAKRSALAERKARRDAGACLSCGGMLCPRSRGDPCLAQKGVLEALPKKWV